MTIQELILAIREVEKIKKKEVEATKHDLVTDQEKQRADVQEIINELSANLDE